MKKKIQLTFLVSILSCAFYVSAQDNSKPATDQPPAFTPSGKVWGYVVADYFAKTHADSAKRGSTQYGGSNYPVTTNAFSFRRIYLGYDYNISEHFSTQLLLANESETKDVLAIPTTTTDKATNDIASVSSTIERSVYIKAANIRWKNFIKNNDLIFGQQATPIYATLSESVWGYRSIEKTIIDMRGLGSSNDFGIAWQGKLNDQGDYGYNFMIGNGTAQAPELNKFKKFYGEIYAKLMEQHIILDLTADNEAASAGTSTNSQTTIEPSTTQAKTTIHGFVAYTTDPITVGLEIVSQTQKAADTTKGNLKADITPFGLSLFIRGQIIKDKLNFFARFDNYNPDTKYDATLKYGAKTTTIDNNGLLYTSPGSNKENFITAGVDWMPVKNVHIMPNIWYDSYSSLKNNVTGTAKSDFDMVERLTVHYIFNQKNSS